jgi:copper(I)-binding protein
MRAATPSPLAVAALAALIGLALAGVDAARAESDVIAIEKAWTRATPKGAKVAAGYLTIKNGGEEPDRLVGARADFAGNTEIHLMNMVDGIMRMRPVNDGLPIPGNSAVTLQPNGYHLMFMELTQPLAEGETVSGTLSFERAGDVAVSFQVMGLGAPGSDAETGQHQHH